jgi:DNA-binding NarL/FixJ family response regulator
MGRARILLADDQPEILSSVARLLEPEFDIVGAVSNGQSVIEAVPRLNPDLLVLDISMPVLSGLEVAARLQGSVPKLKVIFLTVHDDPDFIEAAFTAGASGYVFKIRLASHLLLAVREVLAGRPFVSNLNGHQS